MSRRFLNLLRRAGGSAKAERLPLLGFHEVVAELDGMCGSEVLVQSWARGAFHGSLGQLRRDELDLVGMGRGDECARYTVGGDGAWMVLSEGWLLGAFAFRASGLAAIDLYLLAGGVLAVRELGRQARTRGRGCERSRRGRREPL